MSDIDQRILDASRDLITHYGYAKTTIDDIAREAGVAKTTIYTRWKKKDDLVMATIWREGRHYVHDWQQRMDADPDSSSFAGLFKHALLALHDNAFMMALIQNDQALLGSLFGQMDIGQLYQQRMTMMQGLLARMQAAGAVREDVDTAALAYITNSLQYGLLNLNRLLPDGSTPPLEKSLAIIIDLLEAYITPADGGNQEAVRQIVQEFAAMALALLDQLEAKTRTA